MKSTYPMDTLSSDLFPPRAPRLKRVLKALGIAALSGALVLAVGSWLLLDGNSPLNRTSAIRTATEWARLDPLPKSAARINVEVAGSMFTREFVVTFQAPEQDVLNWLASSPGTQDFHPVRGQESAHEVNPPGGGAVYANVVVLKDGKTVKIRAYWS